MKIALMLHGQARNFEDSFPITKKNLLEKYDVDVYCHLVWDENIKKNGYSSRRGNFKSNEDTPNLIQKFYNPKKIIITEDFYYGKDEEKLFKDFPRFHSISNWDLFFSMCQIYGISQVINLFDWNDYDFIIKLRYDCGIEILPNLFELEKNKIYAVRDWDGSLDDKEDGFIDLSYILSNNFKNYVDMYNNLKTDTDIINLFPLESLYTYYLNKYNLKHNLKKLPLSNFRLKCF
jgi:hypothetical protein